MSERSVPDTLTEYRAWLEENAQKGHHRYLFNVRPYMAHLGARGRVVEFGGYVGATARWIANKGHQVTSIEGADTFADEFEKNVKDIDGIRLVRGLIEDFDETGYDTVSCTEILNHVCDPLEVLKVGHNCLVDGGQMFVTVPARPMRVERTHIGLNELEGLMEQAGFDVREAYTWDDGQNTPQHVVRGYK